MDLDWCFTCGRQTNDNQPYCSKICMNLDSQFTSTSSKARFRDDELQSPPPPSTKNRDDILRWAHAVSPGIPRPPFPLTPQIPAPPCITLSPKHILLSHTARHRADSDDASTDSVITPSIPHTPPILSPNPFPRFVSKLYSWLPVTRQ